MNTQSYSLLYDAGRTLCFVGNTKYNNMLYKYWHPLRASIQLSLEEVLSKDQSWIDQHQFICAVSNVGFKYAVTDQLRKFNPHYFSVIGTGNLFADIAIGAGTFIQHYNTAVCENITIGDHCTLGSYINLSHCATIGNYCHISAYGFINYCNVGEGNLFAARCTVTGDLSKSVDIVPGCNFMLSSVVTKDITKPGTYYGNRFTSSGTSKDYKLL